MLNCENCHLEFENQATLLRHVSHKKVCKSYYGEDRLIEMRIEGKLESKKKWWRENGKKVTQSYQIKKIRIREAKKDKYVCEKQRRSDPGKAFTKFYEFIYMRQKESLLDKLKKSGFAYDKLSSQAEAKAIDLVFDSERESFTSFFASSVTGFLSDGSQEQSLIQYLRDKTIEEEIERAMKEAFEYNFEKQIKKETTIWIDKVSWQISRKCRDQGENCAFNNFFEEFCSTIFPIIQEKSLNFAFSNIEKDCVELDICEEKLEKYLEDRYYESLEELSEKATFDADSDIGYKLTRKMDSRISKQIRYMKSLDANVNVHCLQK